MKIQEVIYEDVDQFLSLLSRDSRVHYELYWKPLAITGGLFQKIEIGLNLYGISIEGFILLCKVTEVVDWNSEALRKYEGTLHQRYTAYIREKWEEFRAIAEEIGATEGKFEYVGGVTIEAR
jgi:hypothetical protein